MLHIGCDVHTHTLYSRHAYSTIGENVRAAAEVRLELLGSADHYSPMMHPMVDGRYDVRDYQFFINLHDWPRMWNGVQLLRGCEADIVDLRGRLFGYDTPTTNLAGQPMGRTLKETVFGECDYVIASIHDLSFTRGASVAECTAAYTGALEDPKVLILGHIGRSPINFDVDEVLTVAKEKNKLIEINEHTFLNHPHRLEACRKIAVRCAEMGVMISTGTDAHISCVVGQFDKTRALLEEIRFPQKLIATTDAATFRGAMERALG